MTYQDEFARRLAQQGGDGKAVGGEPVEPRLAGEQRCFDERHHPNPSSEEEGLNNPVRPEPVEGHLSARRHPSTSSEPTGAAENRHPELVSGPRTSEPDDGGANTPRHAELDSASRAASITGEDRPHPNPSPEGEGLKHTPTIRHDGWHPDLRVKFLEALARTGNVGAAVQYVQRSRQSAYDLKRRDPDFARVWLAALLLARDVAQDTLQERAIEGVEEEIFYHGEVVATRRRYDSRLLLAHLARLDKIAEQIPAQRGAARFADMLDAIGRGEDTAPLIATPTEDELAALAAEAERHPHLGPPEKEEGPEFYAVSWPDDDGEPEFYRMSPEEAEQMRREIPGLVATPTGTADDEVIERLITLSLYGDDSEYEEEEDDVDEVEEDEGEADGEGKNL